MSLNEKINSLKYLLATLVNVLIVAYFNRENHFEVKILVTLIVLTVLNQLMLISGVLVIISPKMISKRGVKAFIYILGKTIILGFGFYLVMTYAPQKVLHSVFIYIFQLIILGLSIKKNAV
jgi:heme/copper-type cytochrome/quinol oxidase subunit 3